MTNLRPRRHLALVLASIILILAGCSLPRAFNYRLTVAIETPEGVRTGSSVRRISFQWAWIKNLGAAYGSTSFGEAVAIDLGKRGYIFALPKRVQPLEIGVTDAHGLITNSLLDCNDCEGQDVDNMVRRKAQALVYRGRYKFVLVRFRNLSDPRSMDVINESDIENILGAGVKIKSMTIAITDDAPTTGIIKLLPWVAKGKNDESAIAILRDAGPPDRWGLNYSDFKEGGY